MSETTAPWQPILESLTALKEAWPSTEWTWDHRIKCLSSTLAPNMVAAGQPVLAKAMPLEWTSESFASSPDHVRALEERCGALRAGQKMLTQEPVAGMVLFGLWWPWGDGVTVGVRVGVANCPAPKELYPAMRALFNIT